MKLFSTINGNEGMSLFFLSCASYLTCHSTKARGLVSSGRSWYICRIWISYWWGAIQSRGK
jgi:hypothetical protein